MTEIAPEPNHSDTRNSTGSKTPDGCTVLEHPLLQHNLTKLRNKDTKPIEFRRVMELLSSLIAYETTREFELSARRVQTPLATANGHVVSEDVVIVAILRAGATMLDGLLRILPFSGVGHVGIYRDRLTDNTVEYYFRLPKNVEGKTILVADPFIGTGSTASATIERLKEYGVGSIRFLSLLASPEGLQKIHAAHPDVSVYTLSLESGLNNDSGYLLPGVGDAGDRLYGTDPR